MGKIVDMKENITELSKEHKELLENRLQRIEQSMTTFKSWDLIKKKYESV